MKKFFKLNKSPICLVALLLISSANLISNSTSVLLWGEPKAPKSLLK